MELSSPAYRPYAGWKPELEVWAGTAVLGVGGGWLWDGTAVGAAVDKVLQYSGLENSMD